MSNTTKEQLEKDIANMEAELQQMQKNLAAMDKPKVRFVKPERGNPYWAVISVDNDVSYLTWDDDDYDNNLWRLGNVYYTKEAAEEALAKQRMRTEILRRIEELNEGWTPDWSNHRQSKYCLSYSDSCSGSVFEVRYYFGMRHFSDEFYLKDSQSTKILMDEFTEAELKQGLL